MRYCFVLLFAATPALAEPPVVEAVQAAQSGSGWRFDVTVSHPDTGWEHYADGWQVETETGDVLGTRLLAHPHETEQPFTRSLSGMSIPEGITTVYIRTKCLVDGWSRETVQYSLK
ncbi:hypothetical protein SAMN05444000_10193 [Shimia gijangensis]|uniref:Secreted protein n=1 Tax=Shimia gijangensis TaxID=1470563 RepID=A0A1M6B099_9RHOB|nr:hypothetical protein [Shimia gijangensis]SHI42136.1 hypothetical protein SAMN05444000_10193 [Shimia gijangensis]